MEVYLPNFIKRFFPRTLKVSNEGFSKQLSLFSRNEQLNFFNIKECTHPNDIIDSRSSNYTTWKCPDCRRIRYEEDI